MEKSKNRTDKSHSQIGEQGEIQSLEAHEEQKKLKESAKQSG